MTEVNPLPRSIQSTIDNGFDNLGEFVQKRLRSIQEKAERRLLKMDHATYGMLKEDINADLLIAYKELRESESSTSVTPEVEFHRVKFYHFYLSAIAFDHDNLLSFPEHRRGVLGE